MEFIFISIFCYFFLTLTGVFLYKIPYISKITGSGGIILGSCFGLAGVIKIINSSHHGIFLYKWQNFLHISLNTDNLSLFFLLPVFLIGLLSALYGIHYLNNSKKNSLRNAISNFFLAMLILSMVFVVTANDIVTFLLAWELMSVSSCFLILYDYEKKETRHAAFIYFIFTQAGAMFIFASFGLFYAITNSFDFVIASNITQNLKLIIFFLAFVGFGSKAGVFPLHVWLPHAHPAAPSHISAIMSGVMIKMGIYGILRLYIVLKPDSIILAATIIILGIVSGFLGVIYALGQSNIKKVLAYSSIENIGIILIGIGLGMLGSLTSSKEMALLGYTGALMHILNHAVFKSLLFMGAGSILHSTGNIEMERLGGLIKKMRLTGITFLIGSVAICGLPPLNGFISEFFIYLSFFNSHINNKWVFILSMIAIISLSLIGGLAVACFTRISGIVFFGEPRTRIVESAHKERPFMIYSMLILAFLCIMIGILPEIFLKYASKTALLLTQSEILPEYELKLFNLADISSNISFAALSFFVLAGFLMLIRRYIYSGKEITLESTWGCGFSRSSPKVQYTGSSFASTIMEFNSSIAPLAEDFKEPGGIFPTSSKYLSKINDIAENFMINRIVLPFMHFIKDLRWIQHGEIQLYVSYIVIALLMMLFVVWVWR